MPFVRSERRNACDGLEAAGPEAATLCEGWDAHDLAAHLWVRENDPIAALGIRIPAFAGRTRTRVHEVKGLLTFTELVTALRQGPPRLSVFGLPGMDEALNAVEYFVHAEDVIRPNNLPEPDRSADFGDWAWKHAVGLAKLRLRTLPIGLVFERSDTGDSIRVTAGSSIVTVIGRPGELLLWVFGRRGAAEVRLVGEDGSIRVLANAT